MLNLSSFRRFRKTTYLLAFLVKNKDDVIKSLEQLINDKQLKKQQNQLKKSEKEDRSASDIISKFAIKDIPEQQWMVGLMYFGSVVSILTVWKCLKSIKPFVVVPNLKTAKNVCQKIDPIQDDQMMVDVSLCQSLFLEFNPELSNKTIEFNRQNQYYNRRFNNRST